MGDASSAKPDYGPSTSSAQIQEGSNASKENKDPVVGPVIKSMGSLSLDGKKEDGTSKPTEEDTFVGFKTENLSSVVEQELHLTEEILNQVPLENSSAELKTENLSLIQQFENPFAYEWEIRNFRQFFTRENAVTKCSLSASKLVAGCPDQASDVENKVQKFPKFLTSPSFRFTLDTETETVTGNLELFPHPNQEHLSVCVNLATEHKSEGKLTIKCRVGIKNGPGKFTNIKGKQFSR